MTQSRQRFEPAVVRDATLHLESFANTNTGVLLAVLTTSDGFDKTLTLVTVCSASRIAFGCASEPIRKLKPGRARLMNAFATAPAALAALVPVDWVLRAEPWSGLRPML